MKYPQLKFVYAYPLDHRFRGYDEILIPGEKYPSIEEVKQVLPLLPQAWADINKGNRAFDALKEVIGAVPTDETMYVYVVGKAGGMSVPLTVSTHRKGDGMPFSKEKMQEIILHEMCHVCFIEKRGHKQALWPDYIERYKGEKRVVFNHVIIYAFLTKVFEKLELGEERIKDMQNHPNPDYKRAIDLMLERGADELLQEYKYNI